MSKFFVICFWPSWNYVNKSQTLTHTHKDTCLDNVIVKVKEQQQNENNFKHKQQQQAKLTDTTDVRQKLHISASRTHTYTVCLSITVSAVACLALVPSLGCACVVGWRKLMHCCLHIHTPPYIHKYIYKRNIYIYIYIGPFVVFVKVTRIFHFFLFFFSLHFCI